MLINRRERDSERGRRWKVHVDALHRRRGWREKKISNKTGFRSTPPISCPLLTCSWTHHLTLLCVYFSTLCEIWKLTKRSMFYSFSDEQKRGVVTLIVAVAVSPPPPLIQSATILWRTEESRRKYVGFMLRCKNFKCEWIFFVRPSTPSSASRDE